MKQGGLIMTCQRALCADSEDKGEPATADQRADEKVPLAPDNGKTPESQPDQK